MPTTIIQSNAEKQHISPVTTKREGFLNISELFCDTLQGEGVTTGVPSTFLRLQGCTLDCIWCDTAEVWKNGHTYSFAEIFALMDQTGTVGKLQRGQHLILTGGSPLKQQDQLINFINSFQARYKFRPFIEVENECTLKPLPEFIILVDQWNNSPKLANSGMKSRARFKPDIIQFTAALKNSWFKFVVKDRSDWKEIETMFLGYGSGDFPRIINRDQIILMPEGQTQSELAVTRPLVAELATEQNTRFCDRLHVTIWDKKTGV